MKEISYTLAFLAGIVSFFSPCVLPLLPSYVTFITGISFEDLTAGSDRKKILKITIFNSIVFISGFSVVFIALGASSSLIGQILYEYLDWLRIIGGVIIIIFGIFIAGFLRSNLLMQEKRIHLSAKPAGYIGTFIVGMAFGAGWTPCIGPILGTILIYSGAHGSAIYGIKLLAVYSLGLALPFLLSSLAINSFLSYSAKFQKYYKAIMIFSGLILIIFGMLLVTDQLKLIVEFLPDFGIFL